MELQVYILDVDWILKDNIPVIRIWGKTKQNKTVVVLDDSFRDWFYIEPKPDLSKNELNNLIEKITKLEIEGEKPEKVEIVKKKLLGKYINLIKIVATNPRNIQKFRDIVKNWNDVKEEFEYGLAFYRRYLIAKNLFPLNWITVKGNPIKTDLKVDYCIKADSIEKEKEMTVPDFHILVFDLELAEEEGEEKIIMASIADNKRFKEVATWKPVKMPGVKIVEGEAELIRWLISEITNRNPDIICGYNTDRFDFIKLEERAKKHKIALILGKDNKPVIFRKRGRIISAQIRGCIHIDIYDFVEHILASTLTSEILTLDRVAQEILGIGKTTMKWKEIEKAWKEGAIEKLAKYCQWDSQLTLELAKHLLPQILELCRLAGQTLFDGSRMTYSQLVEWLLIRKAYEIDEISLNRPKHEEIEKRKRAEPYTGAYVHMPKEGIHENIALFDFRSLYPSIIVSHNISPETLDCEHNVCKQNTVPESNHWFCTKINGFIPVIVKELIELRANINKQMARISKASLKYNQLYNRQFGLKILANAFYGYYGYAGSRWYSRICAQSITAWGRYYIKKVIAMAEQAGFEVLYSDTDSLFLKITSKNQIVGFLDKINKSLPGIMEIEFKDIYKRGLFIEAKTGFAAKKKYALLDRNNQLIIRGMETRRRDWARIAKNTQESVLKAILKDKSPQKAIEIVHKTIENLKKGKVNFDDLIIYTQVTRPLSQYEQIGPHVVAAQKAIQRGRPVGEGSTILYIITKGTGSISERAEPAEDAKNYDPDYYIHHQVIPPALRILTKFGITEDDLLKGKQEDQESLKKFIKH
jgi:DNA polymerase I/DNA polymerase-2